jgi:Fe2+ transport system protein FeoA
MVFNFMERALPMSLPVEARAVNGVVPLADLEPGAVALVETVDDAGPIGRRLLDLGFVPRTRVSVLRRAPLGDPVEFELRGTRLCLRRQEAARIRVRPA